MELSEFANLVQQGASSADNKIREHAEIEVLGFRQENPVLFIKYCVRLLCDDQVDISLRITSATILNMSLREPVFDEYQAQGYGHRDATIWARVLESESQEIRNVCLAAMDCQNTALLNLVSQICAIIYVLEVSNKGWPRLLESLTRVIESSEVEWPRLAAKITAVNTFGHICDLLDSRRIPINTPDHQTIMSGLLLGISPTKSTDDVRIAGFKALAATACYHERMYEEPKVISFIFDSILDNMKSRNKLLSRAALEFLIELVKPLYEIFSDHLERLVPAILDVMGDSEASFYNLPVIATEFWSTVAKEDVYRHKNGRSEINLIGKSLHLTKRIFKDISPKLLSLMESQTATALQNPEGNNLFAACLSAVEHMFESVRDDCIDIGREFIEICMKQNSVASIVAALKTFKCVVKSISPNKAADIVSNAFSKLGAFLLHSEGVVRSAVTELLGTICEFNHEVMMAERVIKEDYHVFYEIMKGDDHELTAGLCDMFATLIVTATHEKYCITWRNLAADMTPLALCLMTRVTSSVIYNQ